MAYLLVSLVRLLVEEFSRTTQQILSVVLHTIMGKNLLLMKLANENNWRHLWIKTDSKLIYKAFNNTNIVLWPLKNKWLNCIHITHNMSFILSHIFRKRNHCADKLASLCLAIQGFVWLNEALMSVFDDMVWNRLNLPYFRFC